MLQTAVKRSLGKNNLSPSLDFESEQFFEINYSANTNHIKSPTISYNPDYNPFHTDSKSNKSSSHPDWQKSFVDYQEKNLEFEEEISQASLFQDENENRIFKCFQIHKRYIVAESQYGLVIVDQHRAHERIMYEHYFRNFSSGNPSSQQELFPNTLELSNADTLLVHDLIIDLKKIGFDVEMLGKNSVVIHGVPAELSGMNSAEILEGVLENYKLNNIEVKLDKRENLARALAKNTCIKAGKELNTEEMQLLLTHLFNCEISTYSSGGKVIWKELELQDLDKLLKNQ
jgi:DNA mismatch repair protein MutL